MRIIDPDIQVTLADYASVASLVGAVGQLRAEAAEAAAPLAGRTVWMINSTAQGGGVAELLPAQIAILRDVGVNVRWIVIESDEPGFFVLTKRLHNLIHDVGAPHPDAADRRLYEAVSRRNAEAIRPVLAPGDIVLVHDPQPLGVGAMLRAMLDVRLIWRCHIGIDEDSVNTAAAWAFLRPYAAAYDDMVFSLAEYAPGWARPHATVIHPSIDPLTHKNRDLSLHKLVGILCDAGLAAPHWPLLETPFPDQARRLRPDGGFAPASSPEDIGLLARPIVTQVSRWDRLKGFAPLLDAFVALKTGRVGAPPRDRRHERRLAMTRLVLAGPDPAAIQDDPEARSVLDELARRYRELPLSVQPDVAILTLPMQSRKHNALMVNALQRASDIVVQNSLREGFGLTVSEAMWKRTAVLGSRQAAGVRLQVRDGVDGRLVDDPTDTDALAVLLHDMLGDSDRIERWGRNAQRRVHDEFLVFGELCRWLRLFATSPRRHSQGRPRPAG